MSIKALNNWPVYCVVILALTGMAWMIPDAREFSAGAAPAAGNSVGGELSMVRATVFDLQGDKLYHMESRRLNYVRNRAALEPLQLVYASADGSEIILQASSGRVFADGDLISLEDDVEIQRFMGGDATETAFTANVKIDLKARFARTREHTVIKRPDHTVSGDGMELDMKQGKMRLLSNVKVQYVQ